MPYSIMKIEDEYCVINDDTNETVKCHATQDEARAHLMALYANVEDAKTIKNEATVEHIAFGGAVRNVADDGNGFEVSGYLVKFTDETNRDLYQTYFTRNTDTMQGVYPLRGKPVLYQHGLDDDLGVIPIGTITEAQNLDDGIFIRAHIDIKQQYANYLRTLDNPDEWLEKQLAIADDYQQRLKLMVNRNLIGFSSGALPQSYKLRDDDGHIEQWAIIEASLTPNPAMPKDTAVTTVKSINPVILRQIVLDAEADATAKRGDDSESNAIPKPENTHDDNEVIKMAEYEEKEMKMSADMISEVVGMAFDSVRETVVTALVEAMDMERADATAMMDDVEDEAKMELMEDEEMKSFLINGNYSKSSATDTIKPRAMKSAMRMVRNRIEAKRKADNALKNDAVGMLNSMKQDAPPVSKVQGNAQKSAPRITDVNNLKYAHLSAEDMLHGYLALQTQMSPAEKARGWHPVSDDYMAHMAHKSARLADTTKFNDIRDQVAVKSALPFRADEIDATNIAGQGSEWVSTLYGSTLWNVARSPRELLGLLEQKDMMVQPIPQGHGSVRIPTEGSDPIAYSTPEANDLDATNRVEVTANIGFFGTGNVLLSPGQIKLAAATTDELIEDSIIPVLPQMQRQMVTRALEVIEQALINGDTATGANTNINLIDGTPATGISRPYYLAVNGLRKYPLVTNTAYARSASGSLDIDDYRLTLGLFGQAVQPQLEKLLFVTDVYTHNSSLAIPEIATDDVRRTNATISSGRIVDIYGVDNYVTGFLNKTQSADGKISATGSNNIRGQIIAVYAPYWAFGYKRDVTFETQRDITSGATVAVASMRFGFVARGADASAITYNVGLN